MSMVRTFLLFSGVGLLVYANAIFHPFVHDDIVFIQQNPAITDWRLSTLFASGVRFDQEGSSVNAYYRPLLEVLYRLQYQAFHLNAPAYHFFNICLHIINSFILFRLLKVMFSVERLAFFVAFFFLIHPVQTESVACISGVSNLLFGFFTLTSMYLYLLNKKRGSYLLFFLGLLSKEQAIILPALIVLYEICLGTKKQWKPLGRSLWPYGLILGGYFLLRQILIGHALGTLFNAPQELGLRILAIPRTLFMYLRIIFLPYDLHYYRSMDILQPFLWPLIFLCAGALGFSLWIRLWDQEKRKRVLFGVGWFMITLAPVLNVLPLINEYSFILTAEHFLYLPLIGVLISVFIFYDFSRHQKVFFLLSIACVGISLWQNTFWRSEVALFERTVSYEPAFGRGHILLAKAYYKEGRLRDALKSFQKALQIMKGYHRKVKDPEIQKFYAGFIRDIYLNMHAIYNNLGVQYAMNKDWSEAIRYFRKALEIFPDHQQTRNNLKKAYGESGYIDDMNQ